MDVKEISLQAKKGRLALLCFVAFVTFLTVSSCHSSDSGNAAAGAGEQSARTEAPTSTLTAAPDSLEVDVTAVRLDQGGWGYKVNVNHRLYIYQRQIPCVSGARPFPTRETALSVAEVVRRKILQGEDPSVTMEELARVLPENLLDEPGSGK